MNQSYSITSTILIPFSMFSNGWDPSSTPSMLISVLHHSTAVIRTCVDTVPHLVDTYALTMPGNIVSLDNKFLSQVCLITSQRMTVRKLAHLLFIILIKTATARTTPIHSIHLMTIHIVTSVGMMQSLCIGQKE
jgi:hypothetical protein